MNLISKWNPTKFKNLTKENFTEITTKANETTHRIRSSNIFNQNQRKNCDFLNMHAAWGALSALPFLIWNVPQSGTFVRRLYYRKENICHYHNDKKVTYVNFESLIDPTIISDDISFQTALFSMIELKYY